MNTHSNNVVTDQHLPQMISSYLVRNRDLLNSLHERVVSEPLPLIPQKGIAPLLQYASR